METLIVYDSSYGNTEKIARHIAGVWDKPDSVAVRRADEVKATELKECDLLVLGSPTHGGRPTEAFLDLEKTIPTDGLAGKMVAVFDTRMEADNQKWALRLLMKTIGYAAPKLKTMAEKKGGKPVGEPGGFFVGDSKGPLKDGELDRAFSWATAVSKDAVSRR